jgi:hypothetical protein
MRKMQTGGIRLTKKETEVFHGYFPILLTDIGTDGVNPDLGPHQRIIDETLYQLAVSFNCACSTQNGAFLKGKRKDELTSVWYERMAMLANRVETEKKRFWEAQGLAKKIGFTVRTRYSDYLPQKPFLSKA